MAMALRRIPVAAATRFASGWRGHGVRRIATTSCWRSAQAAVAEMPVQQTVFSEPVRSVEPLSALAPDPEPVDEFWRKIPRWKEVSKKHFLSHSWSIRNIVENTKKMEKFLEETLPEEFPARGGNEMEHRDKLIEDVREGIKEATMSVRVMPYTLSRIDWSNPRSDPIFRQFIPTKSIMQPDHPKLTLDSLEEEADSPVQGLVHRYPDKALFLPVSVCPTYCIFCTRSYAVGGNTDEVKQKKSMKPIPARWNACFKHIEATPEIQDIVVSGGDSYYLTPPQIVAIGEKLISIPHIRRFRFASKGLAVSPTRILDPDDEWFRAIVTVSNLARKAGKQMALHTHFNHPNEISWVTEEACQKLFEAAVTVRNQSVLLNGVNDDVPTMAKLIRKLADNNITPYYVYQHDMVRKAEHLRTPLQTILDIEAAIRGSIAGFMMPQFVVDLPGGGGKRLASTFMKYDRQTGVSTYMAPAVTGHGVEGRNKTNKVYEYHDPVLSLPGGQA